MNIYVSHLSWGTKSDSLQNLFSQYGEVSSANVITDRETGRSRGFGFVEMPNETEGQAAIDALDGTDFEGKTIGVNVGRQTCRRLRRWQPWRRLRRRLRQQEILSFHTEYITPASCD